MSKILKKGMVDLNLSAKKEKTSDFAPKKDNKVICTLSKKECIYSKAQADTGVYENCRLCEVYHQLYFRI